VVFRRRAPRQIGKIRRLYRLKVRKDDKRAIFTAASHAQKAADYLHGLQPNPDTASAEDLQEAA
jgi:antirestriction protein ArdC